MHTPDAGSMPEPSSRQVLQDSTGPGAQVTLCFQSCSLARRMVQLATVCPVRAAPRRHSGFSPCRWHPAPCPSATSLAQTHGLRALRAQQVATSETRWQLRAAQLPAQSLCQTCAACRRARGQLTRLRSSCCAQLTRWRPCAGYCCTTSSRAPPCRQAWPPPHCSALQTCCSAMTPTRIAGRARWR